MTSFRGSRAKHRGGEFPHHNFVLEGLEGRRLLSISIGLRASAGEALTPSTDIHVSATAGDETEPAIAIDPSNPARMFASADYGPHGQGLFAAYSSDAGATWSRTDASDGVIAQGGGGDLPLACCNSSVAFDRFGNLYLAYLEANTGRTVLAISADGGKTFGTSVRRFGGTNNDTDQPTVIAGPGSNGAAASVWILYTNHDVDPATKVDTQNMAAHGASVNGLGAANVGAFSAVELVPDVAGVAQNFGDVAVGARGQLLVSFQDDRSADGPVTIYASVDEDGLGSGGFSTAVEVSSTNVGGDDAIPAQPEMKIDAAIGLAYDLSGGARNGRVYMVYSDENINESNDIDTWVRYSDDDGTSWSEGARVNDDQTNRSQFLPRIAVDQSSGSVGVSWYDARNDSGSGSGDSDGIPNTNAQVYAAISADGAENFGANVRVSDGTSFHRFGWNLDYGAYSGLVFFGGTLYPVWADNSSSLNNFEVYTDRVVVAEAIGLDGVVNVSEVGGHFVKILDGTSVRYASEAGSVVNVEGGEVTIDSNLHLAGLNMAKIGGSFAGKVDLKENSLLVKGGSVAELEEMVAHGRNDGGYWVGNGISSSVAAADGRRISGIGVVEKSDGILVKYSWNGDADLDGDVDGDDYAKIDAGWAGGLSGYGNGDFDYSGRVNADDYFLIDRAFGEQSDGSAGVSSAEVVASADPAQTDKNIVRTDRKQKRRSMKSAPTSIVGAHGHGHEYLAMAPRLSRSGTAGD